MDFNLLFSLITFTRRTIISMLTDIILHNIVEEILEAIQFYYFPQTSINSSLNVIVNELMIF